MNDARASGLSEADRKAEADRQQYGRYLVVVGLSFNKHDKWPRIEAIQRAVCMHFRVSRDELLSQRRSHRIVRPRQVAMYLAKMLTLKSWPEIARQFADRDHTTAMHAHNRIAVLITTDPRLAAHVAAIRKSLEGAS